MQVESVIAWTADGKGYKSVMVNVIDGEPLLPPNTTVTPPPTKVSGGHYLTVVGTSWVELPYDNSDLSFKEYKESLNNQLKDVSEQLVWAPFIYLGHVYGNDYKDVIRITTAVQAYMIAKRLPEFWRTEDNYPITTADITEDWLYGLSLESSAIAQSRTLETIQAKELLMSLETMKQLKEFKMPEVPTVESLIEELQGQ